MVSYDDEEETTSEGAEAAFLRMEDELAQGRRATRQLALDIADLRGQLDTSETLAALVSRLDAVNERLGVIARRVDKCVLSEDVKQLLVEGTQNQKVAEAASGELRNNLNKLGQVIELMRQRWLISGLSIITCMVTFAAGFVTSLIMTTFFAR